MQFYLPVLLLVSLATLSRSSPVLRNTPSKAAPRNTDSNLSAKTSGRHIIRLRQGANLRQFDRNLKEQISQDASAGPGDNEIVHQYKTGSVVGYAGVFTAAIREQLLASPDVAAIEPDYIGHVDRQQPSPPSWGEVRVSERKLDLTAAYVYSDRAGAGISAYIVDTGIDTNHTEFGGRATFEVNFVTVEAAQDLDGHGTHVAGTIAGATYGLAKSASVHAVKVCDQDGMCNTSDVIAGLQWVVKNAPKFKSVVNISLGLTASQTLDDTVQAAVDAGIAVIVSGGNTSGDSCLDSPRRSPAAFAIGASGKDDTAADFSNWGKCIRMYAPGVDIVSAAPGGGTDTKSGTSMASPHVCGIAALFLGDRQYTKITDLHRDLVARATPGVVKGVRNDTVNLLAYSRLVDDDAVTPPKANILPVRT